MLSRFVAIALLGISSWACTVKDEKGAPDPGQTVDMPPVTRNVVDAGLVAFDMDADVYGSGGGTELRVPDAGSRRDLPPVADAPTDLGGVGAACDVFAKNPCPEGFGCYPKPDGTTTCQQAGFLPGGSQCEPDSSSPDSRCIPGYACKIGICTGLCHLDKAATSECSDSILATCVPFFLGSKVLGYCASE